VLWSAWVEVQEPQVFILSTPCHHKILPEDPCSTISRWWWPEWVLHPRAIWII
jgi:hypothetical protein